MRDRKQSGNSCWPVSKIVVAAEAADVVIAVKDLAGVIKEQTNSKEVVLLAPGEANVELGVEVVPNPKPSVRVQGCRPRHCGTEEGRRPHDATRSCEGRQYAGAIRRPGVSLGDACGYSLGFGNAVSDDPDACGYSLGFGNADFCNARPPHRPTSRSKTSLSAHRKPGWQKAALSPGPTWTARPILSASMACSQRSSITAVLIRRHSTRPARSTISVAYTRT